jgi:hypothetical protein
MLPPTSGFKCVGSQTDMMIQAILKKDGSDTQGARIKEETRSEPRAEIKFVLLSISSHSFEPGSFVYPLLRSHDNHPCNSSI